MKTRLALTIFLVKDTFRRDPGRSLVPTADPSLARAARSLRMTCSARLFRERGRKPVILSAEGAKDLLTA